jgi:NAD(P) transhydrogenase subunit beta
MDGIMQTPGIASRLLVIDISYFLTAVLFIMGLKRMSSPVTARSGIVWAGAGMAVATLVSFLYPGMSNFELIIAAIVVGSLIAWWSGKKVAMTDMPQMIALYNGMGGGAAAAIAAVELYRAAFANAAGAPVHHSNVVMSLAVVGGIIGAISFSGSLIAWAKLQGVLNKTVRFGGQKFVNGLLFLGSLAVGVIVVLHHGADPMHVTLIFVLALLFGIAMTLPIGGADMPVVISLYNALTGLAVAFEGFVMNNAAMIIAGTVVGSAGTLLTQLMAKAMNRSLANVLFSDFGSAGSATATEVKGSMKAIEASDVGVMMAFAQKVIVVPGYGWACRR